MVEKYMQPEQPIAPDDLNALMDLFKLYARQFLLSNPSKSLDLLRRPPVGNPYGYNLDGTTIYVGAEYHYHYSTAIQRMLKHEAKPVVFELGGGFGGMAYYLLRDTKNITYIAADLPENAALQAYYLISHFPDKRIALFGEFDAASFDQEEYDAVIIPNFCIEKLKTDIAHLSFNSYSLAEMDLQSVNNYIHHICRISSRFFYHLNHVVWPVNSDDFPIDYQKFELHSRHPVMWGRDILNCKLDHHEYVYTRK
jgi:putative sugar O-methyltransferase